MINLRKLVFAAALLGSGAALQSAEAMPVANLAANPDVARSAFVFDEALNPARLDLYSAQVRTIGGGTISISTPSSPSARWPWPAARLAAFAALAARRRADGRGERGRAGLAGDGV